MKKFTSENRRSSRYYYSYDSGLARRSRLKIAVFGSGLLLLPVAAVALAFIQAPSAQVPSQKIYHQSSLASTSTLRAPVAQSQLASTTAQSLPLENARLSTLVSRFAGSDPSHQWSVQVQGLGSDTRSASYNAAQKFNSASMYKLLLIYPLLQKNDFDSWSKITLGVNGRLEKLSDCVATMLRTSDNACGDAVGEYVGWGYADAELKDLGLLSTSINSAAGPSTTAVDAATYLKGLYDGQWVSGTARDFILGQMSQQIYRSGIPAGVGSAATVADKIGDLGFVRHDAGIISYSGGNYILSIFTSGASYSQIAQLTSLVQNTMSESY